MGNGTITNEYTVWCGNCNEWQQESVRNKTFAIRLFKSYGWKIRKGKWFCRECLRMETKESERRNTMIRKYPKISRR